MSADSAAAAPSANAFQALDDSKISRFQIKTMFVSGMGFFTDAYDLFVIGIVVSLLKTQWSLSTGQVSWLNSATLLASAFGAIVFGRIADMLGRKRIYGYEVLILAAVGAFLFPDLLASHLGLRGAMTICGVVAAAGLLLTAFSLPETRGKSLEELEEAAFETAPSKLRVQPEPA
jgi:MFS family permease